MQRVGVACTVAAMKKLTYRSGSATIAALALALGLSACGPTDQVSAPTAPTATSQTTTEAAKPAPTTTPKATTKRVPPKKKPATTKPAPRRLAPKAAPKSDVPVSPKAAPRATTGPRATSATTAPSRQAPATTAPTRRAPAAPAPAPAPVRPAPRPAPAKPAPAPAPAKLTAYGVTPTACSGGPGKWVLTGLFRLSNGTTDPFTYYMHSSDPYMTTMTGTPYGTVYANASWDHLCY